MSLKSNAPVVPERSGSGARDVLSIVFATAYPSTPVKATPSSSEPKFVGAVHDNPIGSPSDATRLVGGSAMTEWINKYVTSNSTLLTYAYLFVLS